MLELATARAPTATRACPRSCANYPGAQPRRQAAARRPQQLIRYHASLGAADRGAADSRRLGRGRPRPHRRVGRAAGARAGARGRRARESISATSRCCPAWSTRTRISSCRTCATRCRRRRQFVDWIRGVMAARRQRPDRERPEILDGRRRGHRASASRVRHGRRRRHQQHARHLRRRSPAVALGGVRLLRADRVQRAGSRRRWSTRRAGSIDALAPTERVRVSLAAHAPYSVAPLVFRAIRSAVDRDAFAPCSVHLCGVGRGSRVHPNRQRSVARAARGARRRGIRAWVPPGVQRRWSISTASGFLDARRARRPRRADDAATISRGSRRAARRS